MLSTTDIKWLGQPLAEYIPLENDQKVFHTSQADVSWLFGGNQSGKTYSNMMDLAMLALDVHPSRYTPKGVHWACIESWEQVRDILWEEYLKKFIPPHHIHNIIHGQAKVPRKVLLKNGHLIEFKAFNQGRPLFQGRKVNSIHADEQCHHDLQGIFEDMQARLIAKDGFINWSMTPIIPQPFLEERIEDLPVSDSTFHIDLNDNRVSRGGHIKDDRIDKLIAEWPEETQETRIKGLFASFYGSVYKGFSRAVHTIQPRRIPKDWRRYRGFDFGFTNPFVCLWMAQDKDDNWYVYREYYKEKTGIQEHIANVKRLSKDEQYVESYADPENAEDRSEMRKAGIPTMAARKDIAKGIEHVQSKLKVKKNNKPSFFIAKNCRNTCREFAIYRYPKGTSTRNPADVPVQKDDHTTDVVRYIMYTTEHPKERGSVICAA